MKNATRNRLSQGPAATEELPFIFHESFEGPDAERTYADGPAWNAGSLGFMPDDATRDCTKCMHYAAWRVSRSTSAGGAAHWRRRYFDHRNRIVLGNRKLTFRAVQKWRPQASFAEDLASECQVVLIKAVAAFNPWLGIRFSTYAFTCLMRALSRLTQRRGTDRLARAVPLGALADWEPSCAVPEELFLPALDCLEKHLESADSLLTPREKMVLKRRYHLGEDVLEIETLEQVGRELGLSKERVRQVQSSALGKLRAALLAEQSES